MQRLIRELIMIFIEKFKRFYHVSNDIILRNYVISDNVLWDLLTSLAFCSGYISFLMNY